MKGKKILTRICNALLCVLLAAALVLAAAMAVSKITNKPFFLFGKSAVWIVSESMEDTIPKESFILIEKADGGQVGTGDVIMFKSEDPGLNGGYNTHRLTVTEDGTWITKGDNNLVDDGAYSAKPENVIGKYVKNLPILTAFMRFYSTPAGFILFILLLIGLCAALFLPDMLKKSKQKKQDAQRMAEEAKQKLFDEEMERLKTSSLSGSTQTERPEQESAENS